MSTTDARPHRSATDHSPGPGVGDEYADGRESVEAPRRHVLVRIADAVRAAHAAAVPF
ncbi:hypothetical protein [Pseudonocardia abyssalis]|uniref:Uncharacterized protein n=1 Tax=Pseudonocardia abyssalis TaxID=2792008 RepID=A0ABS6UYG9_9PSEU|nr:hypothetical protein [Pseudonocardia abyssalis]MBW0116161.1 hypothetical protein [Pseudonocardia abyssalis]MBW0137262.1 hypothetical protein [Pseudonocardia abyssalis]